MKKTRIILIIILQFTFSIVIGQTFRGTVLDKSNNLPIPFAEIYYPELKTGTTTDTNGIFKIEHFEQKSIHIQISFIGYKTIDETLNIGAIDKKTFYLEESHYNLEEVVVSAPTGKLQRESVVSVTHLKMKTLQQSSPLTLAETISNIPGVEQNATGSGIGKPIIRGLSGNRIVTYAQGIRIENQQWGDEHGLGVGEIGIESVEVIKGPASLLYGSDALGGVLYFIDERYAKHNTYEFLAQTKFSSNTLGNITDFGFKIHKEKLKFNLFSSYSTQADYQIPNSKRVFNTRFNEKNVKASFGFNQTHWISNIRYSYLQNNFGITEDDTFSNSKNRNFIIPFQIINNHNLSFDNTFFIKNTKLKAILGYTSNYRREFEDDRNNQALGMYLNTATYTIKWNTPIYKEHFSFVLGSQGMSQTNKNNGEEILIPDATTRDFGLFGLANIEYDKLQFQTGIRFDNRAITTKTTQNINSFDNSYQGITFSGGAVYKQEKTKFRVNISSGFRAPNTSELLSNGVHEGTNRYEKGNTNLTNENATQIDFSFNYKEEHFQFSVNPFYNYIKNYIFLSPTNVIIDNNPVFEYLQKDAFLYGGELGIHYHPHQLHWLHFESDLSSVFAEDKSKNALPLIPQTKLNTTLRAEFSTKKRITIKNIYLQHIYKFKQNRIGLFETLSNAYNLVNIGASIEIQTKRNPIEISTGFKNVFNNKYIDHLSRFKKLDIPNQGINYYINLKIKIDRKLKKSTNKV